MRLWRFSLGDEGASIGLGVRVIRGNVHACRSLVPSVCFVERVRASLRRAPTSSAI